jgi:transaldolase
VTRIFHHFKAQGYATVVMGASFRNLCQIEALAGCDRLTIAPRLLDQLVNDNGILTRKLNGDDVESMVRETGISEALFRYSHNEDAMAHEKLGEGIRQFAADLKALKTMVECRLG